MGYGHSDEVRLIYQAVKDYCVAHGMSVHTRYYITAGGDGRRLQWITAWVTHSDPVSGA
jgi:hypothetical protein